LDHEQEKGYFEMNNIVRAWKDETYRQSLSAQEQAMLPANPAGEIELTDTELEAVYGAHEFGRAETIINRVHQDVDQKAAATLGNDDIIINSLVRCSVKTDL
jgi:mersacidin/lichenicidin family type 2 lantibiotic